MTSPRTSRTSSHDAGLRRSFVRALLILAASALPGFGQGVLTQTESDDSFSTANPTGLDATHPGMKIAYGHTADGEYGYTGDFTGDFDFFKLSAAVGQVITVDLKNNALNDDFDSLAAVYNSAGMVVASNDDAGGGSRASRLSYTAAATGTYYVCVSNWVDGPESNSLPRDPMTPGTGNGMPGGTGGPYKVFIGLAVTAPIIEFNGLIANNPVPVLRWVRIPGGTGYKQTAPLKLTNTGNAAYNLTSYVFTGPDAARFSVQGPAAPLSIPVDGSISLTLVYDGNSVDHVGNAVLDFTSNDPLNRDYALEVADSNIAGGGTFTVRQANATPAAGTVNTFEIADGLLAGTNVSSTSTKNYPVINFKGVDANGGFFGSDVPFPNTAGGADNFATQSTGNIYIRSEGEYTFRGFSDDGQRLMIDGNFVFQTTAANVETYGTVYLGVGVHTLEYTHFEGGGGDSAELSISQIQGYFYKNTNGQTSWELLEAYSGDSDNDGLPNAWESTHGLDPLSSVGVNGAAGDPDLDGSTNAAEYVAGTDPQNPDTDADGLKDGVETNTGVWVSATNTGTKPLVADSDADGLLDGVENPNQTTTGLSQPGSDPNKADSDGDGYGDRVEVVLGTDPKVAGSFPGLIYQPLLTENFDGTSVNSAYAFTTTSGTYTPAVADSGTPANGLSAQLSAAVPGANNSIAWNQVITASPQALKLSFDFRLGSDPNPADGIGIGLFRTSAYGTKDALNPGATKSWENPTANGGFPNAVMFGFGIYGTNYIRVTGPAAPGIALGEVASPFTMSSNLFNRAIITAVTGGTAGTYVSLEVIQDVNGAATHHQIFTNVLVPGFDLPNEQVRLIAGVRTGQFFERMDLDNVALSVSSVNPTINLVSTPARPLVGYIGVLQSSTDLVTFTDVVGATPPYQVPPDSPAKLFFRSRRP
jgi:hypothetical protein